MVLIGNKTDLENEREVTEQETQDLAEKLGIASYEICCKYGEVR